MRYHIVVTGSTPSKTDGKFDAMPAENVAFIENVLAKLAPADYVALYVSPNAGTAQVATDWAFKNNVRIHEFPAYWFDPTKPENTNKQAGYQAGEYAVRTAKSAVYNKEGETVIVLAFHSTDALSDDAPVNAVVKFATERNSLTTKVFHLPIAKAAVTAPARDEGPIPAPHSMMDPFDN